MAARLRTSRSSTVTSTVVEPGQAPLAGDLEAAHRLDLVAEQLDPHRIEPVGGEDVEDPAAERDLAGQFHGRGVVETVLGKPRAPSSPTSISSPTRSIARVAGEPLPLRDRLEERLDAGHENLGGGRAGKQLQYASAVARPLRRGPRARWAAFPRRRNFSAGWTGRRARGRRSDRRLRRPGGRRPPASQGRARPGRLPPARNDDPQTPSRVAACPACRLATTSEKPSCRSRHAASSRRWSRGLAFPASNMVEMRFYRRARGGANGSLRQAGRWFFLRPGAAILSAKLLWNVFEAFYGQENRTVRWPPFSTRGAGPNKEVHLGNSRQFEEVLHVRRLRPCPRQG